MNEDFRIEISNIDGYLTGVLNNNNKKYKIGAMMPYKDILKLTQEMQRVKVKNIVTKLMIILERGLPPYEK